MHISEPEDRTWSPQRLYSQALEEVGYGDLISGKIHIAIGHFLKRLNLIRLYKRMLEVIMWRKERKFDEEEFDRFVREVVIQAKKIQSEQRGAYIPEYKRDRSNLT